MTEQARQIRALGLCSGGLDSILSGLVLRNAGIEVEWITFETPFFDAEKARKASEQTGIPLRIQDITAEYLEMLHNPRCGYGQHMNPCLDCHALMFRIAGGLMGNAGFDFLFSGEVLGQRPMSQTRPSLRYVEKHSGFPGYIVRPLSAQRMEETVPERLGQIDRSRLLGFTGRSRKPQMALAEKWGITDYPAPAGGCLLTDKMYSIRLRELFRKNPDYAVTDLHLLKYGRHFRTDSGLKFIVGRNKNENEKIREYYRPKSDIFIKTVSHPGPALLIPQGLKADVPDLIPEAAAIAVGYSKAPAGTEGEVVVFGEAGRISLNVNGVSPDSFRPFMIVS